MADVINGKSGDWRYIVMALGIVTLFSTGAFTLGVHVGNGDIHQTQADKRDMIYTEVDRTVAPLRADIKRVEVKVDKLLAKE